MKKKLLLFYFTVLFSLTVIAQKTYNGPASGNWETAANWSPSGVPAITDDVIIPSGRTVSINVDAFAKSISVSGTLALMDGIKLTVGTSTAAGTFTVNSGGNFNILDENGSGTIATLIVYGNYINNGVTDFWKGTVIITGDLSSPSSSELQNNGNVIVGGNIIGSFDLTGGTGTNQIYALNPNATVNITPNTIVPGNNVSGESIAIQDIVNTVIFGGACPFTTNDPSSKTVCEGSSVIFSVSTSHSTPNFQWQINTGTGWNDLTNGGIYSGVTSADLTITSVTTAMSGYEYRAKITGGGCTKNGNYAVLTVNASTAQPTVGSAVQPTCSVANGSFSITNYNASYTYTVSPSTGVTISGSTVPAPAGTYTVTATSGTCPSIASASIILNPITTNTWNGMTWSTGSAPTNSQRIVFAGNYSSSTDITGCSCQINSGNVIINSGNTLSVTDAVTVSGGSLTFENNSSLLQTNASAVNSGNIIYKRKTTPLKQYDYTYWASPVANATLSQLATNSLFYEFSPSINNWVNQGGSATMILGKGYIGRAPSNLNYATAQTVETNFTGTPNNGTITTPIVKGAGIANLIGNPYPSAIDIDLFLTDAANSGIVSGTIYLWTHNTAISSSIPGGYTYNYTVDDYAKYNLTGGLRTASAAITGGAAPTGKIAAGQSFLIEANTALANGSYTATFRNSMRVSGNNNQFFRNSSNENNTTPATGLEKHRVWLSLSNTEGAYNEALVGYIQNATNEVDRLFDAKNVPSGNTVAIYSMLANEKLSIQGRALPFADTEIIPIGYTTTIDGQFSISLENFDGQFDNQNVYLFDNNTGIYHDLKAAAFTFTTVSGEFNNRFELRFTNPTLSIDPQINTAESLIILTKDKEITVKSSGSNIASVQVRDLLGKLVYSQNNILSKEFRTNGVHASSQMLIVKVTFDNKQTIVKKALMP